jgi:phage FluMu gp28-like protein
MREELDCIPRDGSGVAIPTVLIERAMREERPVLRLSFDKEWALKSQEYRQSFAEDWIRLHVQPLLDKLDTSIEHSFGSDYARHRDFAQFAPIAVPNNLSRYVPFVIEMHNVPTKQQEQIIWHCIEHLPRFRAGAMDATGSGAILAEYTADKFGHDRIIQVTLNDAWYREHMRLFQDAFTDDVFDLPKDGNLRNDLRALEVIDGIIKLPKLTKKDLKEPEKKRHGDFAIALALGYIATLHDVAPCEFFVGGQHRDLGMFRPDHGNTDITSILDNGIDWSGFND